MGPEELDLETLRRPFHDATRMVITETTGQVARQHQKSPRTQVTTRYLPNGVSIDVEAYVHTEAHLVAPYDHGSFRLPVKDRQSERCPKVRLRLEQISGPVLLPHAD
jgi:hypothetical protein